MSDSVELSIVRERNGNRIRCIYIGHLRVYGAKPYVTENLPSEFYAVKIADLEEVLRFARATDGLSDAQNNGETE